MPRSKSKLPFVKNAAPTLSLSRFVGKATRSPVGADPSVTKNVRNTEEATIAAWLFGVNGKRGAY